MGASGDTIRLGIEVTEQQQARAVIQGLDRDIAKLRSQILALAVAGKNADALGNSHHIHQLQALRNALSPIAKGNDDVDKAARRAAQGQAQVATVAQGAGQALNALVGHLVALATAFAGFRAFEAFVSRGIEFNKTVESATLGIGALITSQAQLRESDGRLLTGAEALAVAQTIAADQLDKLRAEGLKTHATMSDLILAFQQAIGVSLRFGFSLDQAREFTIGMVRAAFALQLPLGQLQEEIRDFLQGNINPRNTRIAAALSITNEQVKSAQAAGKLFEFVQSKLEAFNAAGDATAATFIGITSNAKQFFEVFSGAATKPLFDEFKRGAQQALAGVFNLDTAQVSEKFRAILDVVTDLFGRFGGVLADALNGAVEKAQDFNNWLKENEGEISAIADAFGLAASALGTLTSEMLQFVGSASDGATQSGAIRQALVGAGLGVAALNTLFEALVGAIGVVGAALATLLVGPIGLLLIGVGKLVQVFDKDLGRSIEAAGQKTVAWVRGAQDQISLYIASVNKSGDAIDRYLAKIKALDAQQAQSEGARKVRDELRETTATLRDQAKQQETDLKASLDQRLITRAEYSAKLKVIQLSEVKSEEQATLSAIRATTDPRLKRALFDQIATLQQRRELLEKGITLTATPAPETDKDRAGRLRALNVKADDEIRAAKSLADRLTAERAAAFADEMAQVKNQFDSREAEQIRFAEDIEKIQFQSLEKQKAAEQHRADALAGDPEQVAARQKALDRVADLTNAEFELIADTDAKIAAAHRQALEARHRLDEQGVKDEIELLRERGEIVKATALELENQYKDELEALAKRTDEAARAQERNIHAIIDTRLLKAEFQELDRTASDALTHLSQKETEITTLRQTGAISEREARRELIGVYKDTGDVLGGLIPQLEAIAERTGDRESIERVRALKAQFQDMRITISQVDEDLRKLASGATDALESGLAQGLDEMADGAHKVGDAWRDAALSVVASLRRIATQMLANLIIQQALSFFGGLFGPHVPSATSALSGNAGIGDLPLGGVRAADGAYVDVPGRPTNRDTIPALLANKEFIVSAPATAAVGPDALHDINRGRVGAGLLRALARLSQSRVSVSLPSMPATASPYVGHYAGGGLVDRPPLAAFSAGGLFRLIVEHSEDVIIRKMDSPEGQAVTVRTLGKNRNGSNAALGRR